MKLQPKDELFKSIETKYSFFNDYYKYNYGESEEDFRKYINSLYKKCRFFDKTFIRDFDELDTLSKKYCDKLNANEFCELNTIYNEIIRSKLYIYCNDFLLGCFRTDKNDSLIDEINIKYIFDEDDINEDGEYILSIETSNNDCMFLTLIELTDETCIKNKKIKNIYLYVLGNPFKITNGQIYSFLNKLYDNITSYIDDTSANSIKNLNSLIEEIDWSDSSSTINDKIKNNISVKWLFKYGYKEDIIKSLENIIKIKNQMYKEMSCKYYLALNAESIESKDSIPEICRIYIPE